MSSSMVQRQRVTAVALSAAAGFVDAFGYLSLSHVFTAQMSGNTVLIAVHAFAGDERQSLYQAFTVAMFFAGLVISGTTIEAAFRVGLRHVLAIAMLIEAGCLTTVALLIHGAPSGQWEEAHNSDVLRLLIALTAIAMGIQNTSLRMTGVLTVYTTHVTGALTKLGEDLVSYAFALRTSSGTWRSQSQQPSSGALMFSLGIYGGFLFGAAVAAFVVPNWGPGATLVVPIATVTAIAVTDFISPLARRQR